MNTVETALIVPLIICMILAFFSGTIQVFRDAYAEIEQLQEENTDNVRQPAEVIRNTDIVFSYLEEET